MSGPAGHAQDRFPPGWLAWRCRRGMKELDLLLESWLRTQWVDANDVERQRFAQFLELPDPEIAAVLLGGESPRNPAFESLVRRLRAARSGVDS